MCFRVFYNFGEFIRQYPSRYEFLTFGRIILFNNYLSLATA